MAKREVSSTLKNLKFMQRAAQREEKTKKEEELKPDGNFSSPGTFRKCMVIMEGDPHPGAVIGRMSFQSFNPSVEKLNDEASNPHTRQASNSNATSSSGQSGNTSFREDESAPDKATSSNSAELIGEGNGDLKRKHREVVSGAQNPHKSARTVQSVNQPSPNSSRGSFKQPKNTKLDWSVLRPKNRNKSEQA